jgi:hypothetical protein
VVVETAAVPGLFEIGRLGLAQLQVEPIDVGVAPRVALDGQSRRIDLAALDAARCTAESDGHIRGGNATISGADVSMEGSYVQTTTDSGSS